MKRLILRGIDRSQIIGALIGCLLGFTVLLGGVQLYFDLKPVIGGNSEVWDPSYYVLNKKVSMLDNLSESGSGFDSSERERIAGSAFVKDMAPFKTSEFRIRASTSERKDMPGLRTQLFFEAVPDRFLDIDTGKWEWHEDGDFLPVIVPSHYIALYNFGFARSQNLPRISKNAIERVSFRLIIEGQGRSESFKSRIVAFSDRINSILVPQDFLEWGNEKFGRDEGGDPSRLILSVEDRKAGELFAFADEQNYEVQGGNRKTGKLSSLLDLGLGIVAVTASIIIVLAAWMLIISFRLLIVKNLATIQKLHLLGYDLHRIARVYMLMMGIFSGIILLGAFGGLYFLRRFYIGAFDASGFELSGYWSLWTVLVALMTMLLINGANKLLLDKQLRDSVKG